MNKEIQTALTFGTKRDIKLVGNYINSLEGKVQPVIYEHLKDLYRRWVAYDPKKPSRVKNDLSYQLAHLDSFTGTSSAEQELKRLLK